MKFNLLITAMGDALRSVILLGMHVFVVFTVGDYLELSKFASVIIFIITCWLTATLIRYNRLLVQGDNIYVS